MTQLMRDRGCPSGQSIANPQKSAMAGSKRGCGMLSAEQKRSISDARFQVPQGCCTERNQAGYLFHRKYRVGPSIPLGSGTIQEKRSPEGIPVGVGTNSIDWVPFTLNNQSRSAGIGRN